MTFNSHSSIATYAFICLTRTRRSPTTWITWSFYRARLAWNPTTTARAPRVPAPNAVHRAATLCIAILSLLESMVARSSAQCGHRNPSWAGPRATAATFCAGAPTTPMIKRAITFASPASSSSPWINRREKTSCKEQSHKDHSDLHAWSAADIANEISRWSNVLYCIKPCYIRADADVILSIKHFNARVSAGSAGRNWHLERALISK